MFEAYTFAGSIVQGNAARWIMTGQHVEHFAEHSQLSSTRPVDQISFRATVQLRLDVDGRLRLRELSHEDFDMAIRGGAPPVKDPELSPQHVLRNPH